MTIQNILDSLNRESTAKGDNSNPWKVDSLLNALTIVTLDTVQNKAMFTPNAGIVVKVFTNKSTGEVRTFMAKLIDDIPGKNLL